MTKITKENYTGISEFKTLSCLRKNVQSCDVSVESRQRILKKINDEINELFITCAKDNTIKPNN